jgi:hypothetical protein
MSKGWAEQGWVPYEDHLEELAKIETKAWKHYEAELTRIRKENHDLIKKLDKANSNGFLTWEERTK